MLRLIKEFLDLLNQDKRFIELDSTSINYKKRRIQKKC